MILEQVLQIDCNAICVMKVIVIDQFTEAKSSRSQIKLSKLNRISLTQEMMQMYLHHMNEEEMGPKRFWPKNKF